MKKDTPDHGSEGDKAAPDPQRRELLRVALAGSVLGGLGLTPLAGRAHAGPMGTGSDRMFADGFEARSAPPGAAAVQSAGAVLKPMSSWTGALPWTAGFCFAFGEIPAGERLGGMGEPLQVEVRNRWPDGSLKFAVVSGVTVSADIPLQRGGIRTTGSAVAEPAIDASVTFTNVRNSIGGLLHSVLVANLASARAAGLGPWSRTQPRKVREIPGPVMSEFHYFVPTADAHTSVWYYVRAYSNGTSSVRVVVQNSWTQVAAPGSRTYNVDVGIGGTSRYSAANLVHLHHTRWTQLHWVGAGGVMAQSVRHLQDTALAPRAALDSVDDSVWTMRPDDGTKYAAWTRALAERPTPFDLANIDPALGAGGATDNVGPLPAWDMTYVITGDARAYWAVLGNAEAMGRFCLHYVDEVTGNPLEPSRYPNLRASGGGVSDAWGGSPATPSPSGGHLTPVWSYTHGPKGGYLAYLLTGEWHHLQTVQHFSGFVPLWQPGDAAYRYGGPHTPIPFWLQLRGNANAWDFHFKAAIITPDRINDSTVTGPEADLRNDIIARNDVSIRLWHDIYAPTGTFVNTGPYVGRPQSLRNNVFGVFYQENNVPVPEATVSQMQQGYAHNAILWGFLARVPTNRQAELEWLTQFCTRYQVGMLGATPSNPRPEWRLCTGFEQVVGSADPYDGNWVMFPSWRAAWDLVAARPPAPSTELTLPLPAGNFIHEASEVYSTPSWTVGFEIRAAGQLSPFGSHTHAFIWSVAFMHEVSKRLPIAGADLAADRFYGSDSFFNAVQPNGSWTLWPGAAVVSREWVPIYVPRTVGEAALVPMTNFIHDVHDFRPGGGSPEFVGDFSGGIADTVSTRFGELMWHGGGHSASNQTGIYGALLGWRTGTFRRRADTADLVAVGRFVASYPPALGVANVTSFDYFIQYGPNSTNWENYGIPNGRELPDDVIVNPREVLPNVPGSAHTYGNMMFIPPWVAGNTLGKLLRPGSKAVGPVVSRNTVWQHAYDFSSNRWERWLPGTSLPPSLLAAADWSLDTRRWRIRFGRGHIDLRTREIVANPGSVGSMPAYEDTRLTDYHPARDILISIRNSDNNPDEINGTNYLIYPSRWYWWPADSAADTGARNLVTWANGIGPPNVAGSVGFGATCRASVAYIPPLQKFAYKVKTYWGADARNDKLFLISVPENPAAPWTWEEIPITGSAKPSTLGFEPRAHVYGRMQYLPALKSLVELPLRDGAGHPPFNHLVVIRLVP